VTRKILHEGWMNNELTCPRQQMTTSLVLHLIWLKETDSMLVDKYLIPATISTVIEWYHSDAFTYWSATKKSDCTSTSWKPQSNWSTVKWLYIPYIRNVGLLYGHARSSQNNKFGIKLSKAIKYTCHNKKAIPEIKFYCRVTSWYHWPSPFKTTNPISISTGCTWKKKVHISIMGRWDWYTQ
jgi:hypothetical protein